MIFTLCIRNGLDFTFVYENKVIPHSTICGSNCVEMNTYLTSFQYKGYAFEGWNNSSAGRVYVSYTQPTRA